MHRVAKYYEFGEPLKVVKIEEEKTPTPESNQVLLGMEAACLHLADVYRVTAILQNPTTRFMFYKCIKK